MRPTAPIRTAAAIFLVLALAFGLGSAGLGFHKEGVPGPGLLPLVASLVLLPLAVGFLVRPDSAGRSEAFGVRPPVAIALLLVYALVLPRTGFVPATLVLLLVWVIAFHDRRPLAAVAVAILATGAGAALFRGLLGVPLPLWP